MAAVYERNGEWLAVPRPVPLVQVVRAALLNALAYCDGHQAHAAHLLGLSERQMSYQLREHAIPTGGRGRPRRALRIVRRRRTA